LTLVGDLYNVDLNGLKDSHPGVFELSVRDASSGDVPVLAVEIGSQRLFPPAKHVAAFEGNHPNRIVIKLIAVMGEDWKRCGLQSRNESLLQPLGGVRSHVQARIAFGFRIK